MSSFNVVQFMAFSSLEFSWLLLEGYPLCPSLFITKTAGITTLLGVDVAFLFLFALTKAAAP